MSTTRIYKSIPRVIDSLKAMRTGTGAVKLPPEIQRIHVAIQPESRLGGDIMRQVIPRLAFNNPHVQFTRSPAEEMTSNQVVVHFSIFVEEF